MLNFIIKAGTLVSVTTDYTRDCELPADTALFNRNDFKSFEVAEEMAVAATKLTGKLHIATDAGKWSYPQFDVIAAPAVGEKVSQSFNGDSYPRGEIVSVSKTLKLVTTSTGHKFYRLRNTGSWLDNGYACMIAGHVSEMNPSF
jgi:hypothetical protein